jgi:hypothetical protein
MPGFISKEMIILKKADKRSTQYNQQKEGHGRNFGKKGELIRNRTAMPYKFSDLNQYRKTDGSNNQQDDVDELHKIVIGKWNQGLPCNIETSIGRRTDRSKESLEESLLPGRKILKKIDTKDDCPDQFDRNEDDQDPPDENYQPRKIVLILVRHDQLSFPQAYFLADKQPEKGAKGHDANPAKLQDKSKDKSAWHTEDLANIHSG